MKYLLLAVALFMAALVPGKPASAWETVGEMNEVVDSSNFIVGSGCSGTLISVEYRLIVTAFHCIKPYISTVTRDEVGPDGKIEKVQYERLRNVTVQQKDYDRFSNVGSVSYETRIVAHKQERDLALLQLVGDNLRSTIAAPVLPLGEDIARGEPVVAVGNPRGLDASVTSGVISSTSRTFRVPWALNEEVPLLQFDADIQPGSSGGALMDSRGRYIGTTVAGFPASNLGLAIPVYELQTLLADECFGSVVTPGTDDEACRNPEAKETAQ